MGPLEDEDNRNDNYLMKNHSNADSSDVETQQIDSQFCRGGVFEGDGADDFPYFTDTMPADDTYLLEDEFETQFVDLAGETQAVDLAGETQAVDLAGETQVLDDLEIMNDMPIEFLNKFNAEDGAVGKCEAANKIEALCETQELSQGDSVETNGSDLVGLENTTRTYSPKQESGYGGFTSIRTASIRMSGLAARASGANGNSCSTSCDKYSLERQTCERDGSSLVGYLLKLDRENVQECLQSKYNEDTEELTNLDKYKVGSAAVRKLFSEDEVAEVGRLEADVNHTDDNLDMPELLASENCLAGLSYANSQEPGELSQAHALEVVDKFLDISVMECYEGFGMKVQNAEIPKVVSVAKGSRDLAKSSTLKSTDRECGIYDWDDTREDDGGGDFFLKKKELFFDKEGSRKRCLTGPRKPRCPDLGSLKAVENNGDEKEQNYTKNKLENSVYSDSGLMLHNVRAKGKSHYFGEKLFHKNLMKDLDEQPHVVSSPKLAENDTNRNVSDIKDIGPDTQMAAEAIETLCFEVHLAESNSNGPSEGANSMKKPTRKNQLSNKTVLSAQPITPKRPCLTSIGVVTRQAKKLKRTSISASNEPSLSPKGSKTIRKKRDMALPEAEQSRLADHDTESTAQRPERKCDLEDKLDFSVPVAHRTRKCTELNRPKAAANSSDAREVMNGLTSARKQTAVKYKNAEKVTIEKVKKVGPTGFKPSNRTCGTLGASNINAIGNLQGKRSRQGTLPVGHEAGTQNSGRSKRSRENGATQCDSDHVNVKASLAAGACTYKQLDKKSDAETSTDGAETSGRVEASSRERCGTSSPNCATPATCFTLIKNVSPLCVGDEYHKQSCRKNLSLSRLSLITEIDNLVTGSPGSNGEKKGSRKRKDITNIRVLFSQHLDVDVMKQQKKILARLGGAVAISMSDATHFVADEFVRTRNMLEAIASGKPVVTHLWLESCGQASCLIDEKNYILRDARKEREFGFSLPVSLSRACQHPLLQGQKVLVTPSTKPGKDILANLVKAVHGLAIERLGRSVLKEEKLPDDLLILSCEEDYDTCVPFLEKGGAVYSSELLLNGIVKQKLEYERHRLFADDVKRTRSTIWVKKKNRYLPVTKSK